MDTSDIVVKCDLAFLEQIDCVCLYLVVYLLSLFQEFHSLVDAEVIPEMAGEEFFCK